MATTRDINNFIEAQEKLASIANDFSKAIELLKQQKGGEEMAVKVMEMVANNDEEGLNKLMAELKNDTVNK